MYLSVSLSVPSICFLLSVDMFICGTLVSQLVAAFTNSTAMLEVRKGGPFSLLGGLISGEYMELVSQCIM